MKILVLFFSVLMLSQGQQSQNCRTVKAKDAHRYVGKEIIVTGKFIQGGNSSYARFAWFYLGGDTSHRQIKVLIQGKQYAIGTNSPIANYGNRKIQIKGIVRVDKEIYLEATDTLKLKQ